MLILCLVLAAAAALVIITAQNRGKTARGEINVYVNGALYTTAPLQAGKDIVVRQEDGKENVIRMTEDGFYMLSATCSNQDCIYQGPVTQENWRQRILSNHVICLPNRVDVTLVVEQTDPALPDV